MKRGFIICLAIGLWLLAGQVKVAAQVTELEQMEEVIILPNSQVEKVEVEKVNITEPKDEGSQTRLIEILNSQEVGKWNGANSLRKMIRWAVDRGVPANTIVLIFLLPLIATAVSILHYVFGLSGYGIFTPTMMAVTLLNTGIVGGLVLFLAILATAVLGRVITAKMKLHYWPSRSINLTFTSLVAAMLMFGSSYFRIVDISKISIFPVLFMIMLSEDFVRTQLAKSKKEAKRLTIGTLMLSILGAVLMNVVWLQEKVLLYPEMVILLVLVINLWVGSYKGIRFSEFKRFAKAIRN